VPTSTAVRRPASDRRLHRRSRDGDAGSSGNAVDVGNGTDDVGAHTGTTPLPPGRKRPAAGGGGVSGYGAAADDDGVGGVRVVEAGGLEHERGMLSMTTADITAAQGPIRAVTTRFAGDGYAAGCGAVRVWVRSVDAKASPVCGHGCSAPSRTVGPDTSPTTATIAWPVAWSGGGVGIQPALRSMASALVAVVDAAALNTRS
jgi:hypothetical protein